MNSEKKEIKKALECCANWSGQASCKDCPIGFEKCFENENLMPQLALTLINELESENERLSNTEIGELIKENEELAKQCVEWSELDFKKRNKITELKDRIAELEKHIQNMENEVRRVKQDRNRKEELASKYMDVYNDSLKQFAERLKEKIVSMKWAREDTNEKLIKQGATIKAIDETLKEFLNETNE